jgi:hypothetical protein
MSGGRCYHCINAHNPKMCELSNCIHIEDRKKMDKKMTFKKLVKRLFLVKSK